MTDTHTEALVERVARAMEPTLFRHGPDNKVGPATLYHRNEARRKARAAIEALPARNDERALKLVEALRALLTLWDYTQPSGEAR